MKKIITMLLLIILLSGCDAPVTVAERTDELRYEHEALQVEYDNLLLNYGILEKAKDELSNLRDEHNKLITEYTNLQTKYAILESYYKNLQEQYTALLPQIGKTSADKDKAMKEMARQYALTDLHLRQINEQIEAVHTKNVPLLSANLTDIEYNAFYKGWELWWWTFNEKDEEDE